MDFCTFSPARRGRSESKHSRPSKRQCHRRTEPTTTKHQTGPALHIPGRYLLSLRTTVTITMPREPQWTSPHYPCMILPSTSQFDQHQQTAPTSYPHTGMPTPEPSRLACAKCTTTMHVHLSISPHRPKTCRLMQGNSPLYLSRSTQRPRLSARLDQETVGKGVIRSQCFLRRRARAAQNGLSRCSRGLLPIFDKLCIYVFYSLDLLSRRLTFNDLYEL